jgi:protein arginine kinase
MIDLSLLTDGGVGWLDASGPSSHLVLSTRIRLARNLAGRVYQGRNSESEREDILQTVEAAARDTVLLRRAIKFRLDRMDRSDRQLLHERHLVSKELAGLDADGRVRSGASVLVQDRLGVMLNEEDHLRLQGLHSGFALDAAYAEVDRLDAIGWTPNWDNDLLSHFTRNLVTLPPVLPTSVLGSGPRCSSTSRAWCSPRKSPRCCKAWRRWD